MAASAWASTATVRCSAASARALAARTWPSSVSTRWPSRASSAAIAASCCWTSLLGGAAAWAGDNHPTDSASARDEARRVWFTGNAPRRLCCDSKADVRLLCDSSLTLPYCLPLRHRGEGSPRLKAAHRRAIDAPPPPGFNQFQWSQANDHFLQGPRRDRHRRGRRPRPCLCARTRQARREGRRQRPRRRARRHRPFGRGAAGRRGDRGGGRRGDVERRHRSPNTSRWSRWSPRPRKPGAASTS